VTMPDSTSPTVLTLITAGLTEVKDAVTQLSRDLHGTLARLPTDYVPRREVERRIDELTIDLGAERAARISALQALQDAHDAAALERATNRRWLIGLVVASGVSMVGVGSGVVLHFS